MISGEFGVFDESAILDEVLEVIARNEVVLFSMLFSWPG